MLHHIVANSQQPASAGVSGSVILAVASNFHGFMARHTLNKLDTSSNEVNAVRNPQAGYVATLLCLVVTQELPSGF